MRLFLLCCLLGLGLSAGLAGAAAEPQQPKVAPAPPRQEGDGPYSQLILRNATVINGTGAPAFGPADIVIEGNRIVRVMSVGSPGGVKEAAETARSSPPADARSICAVTT